MPPARLISILLMLLSASGCTAIRRPFPDQDARNVWAALVAVAEAPDYQRGPPSSRWVVQQNAVHADPVAGRIEIYRELARIVRHPDVRTRREERLWRFRVTLESEGMTPTATFVCRDWALPAEIAAEANRYFDDVLDIVHGRTTDLTRYDRDLDALGLDEPPPPMTVPDEPDEPEPAEAEEEERRWLFDVDDLDPG